MSIMSVKDLIKEYPEIIDYTKIVTDMSPMSAATHILGKDNSRFCCILIDRSTVDDPYVIKEAFSSPKYPHFVLSGYISTYLKKHSIDKQLNSRLFVYEKFRPELHEPELPIRNIGLTNIVPNPREVQREMIVDVTEQAIRTTKAFLDIVEQLD